MLKNYSLVVNTSKIISMGAIASFMRCFNYRHLLFFITLLFCFSIPNTLKSQCTPCGAVTFTINLTSAVNITSVQIGPTRSGTCCSGSNCINFVVLLNPGSDLLSFNVTNPAPAGAAFYQINCGGPVAVGAPACISNQSVVCITYCKPGGDNPNYTFIATKNFSVSPDYTVRVGCSQTMTVTGLSVPSITWTSISPSVPGTYNGYLNCVTGCSSSVLTPTAPTPTVITYQVSGNLATGCPGVSTGTVKATIVPGMSVNITPTNAVVCSGGTGSVVLTATATGGQAPYTYSWSTGVNTQTVNVTAGTYTVLVNDATSGCSPIAQTITVNSITTPTAPTAGSNSPLCAGQTLSLTASPQAGVSYSWTGPSSFTSTVQNPSIPNASVSSSGNYSVTATFSGCVSPPGVINVIVNPIPAAPSASANTPLCAGQNLNLTATFTAGVTYNWSGPNSFTSTNQNPTIAGITLAGTGIYSVNALAAGCPGPTQTISVVVNSAPAAPTAGANSPLCTGQTLSLTATFTAGATYSWSGPNGFSSAIQDPTIAGATTAATGLYSVTATIAGCTGPVGTISVNVSTAPAAPTVGSNGPLCVGQTLNLTSTFTAGLTYSWSGPNGFTSVLQNPSVAGITLLDAGTYSVFATTAGGCSGPTGTISVVVNNSPGAPTVGANTPLCAGQTLNLTSTFTAGATYSWSGPNTFTSNTQNPSIASITLAGSGVYSVNATIAGCPGPNGTISVVVNPIPGAPSASNNSPLCVGQTLNLISTFSAGATYSWTGPNGFTSTSQNPSIVNALAVASGNYSVTMTVGGCSSTSGVTTATVSPPPATPVAGSNGPLCDGQNLNLTSSLVAGATYSWSGPNGFTSALQNPSITGASTLAAGSYSVFVTVGGCSGSIGTIAVIINPTPATPSPLNNSPLCVGQTLNLTTSAVAGATYSWAGPSGFTSASQNPSIVNAQTTTSGTYSLTLILGGCTSSVGLTTATVSPPPTSPTAGSNGPVCVGQTLSLTASTIAGASYSWSGPNGFTSSVQNPSITGVSLLDAGTYTVFASIGVCVGPVATIAVVVNPTPSAPTVGANSPLCAGQTLNLTSTFTAGATYSWSGPNTFTSTNQNPSIAAITIAGSGVYSVNATVAGCPGPSGTISVVVNPIPTAPTATANTPLCVGQTMNLSTTFSAGATYNWSGPNAFISTLQNPSIVGVTLLASGIYSVSQTVNGCASPLGVISLTVNPIPAPPTVTSNAPICALQTLSLNANPSGSIYNWIGPNSFTSTLQNPTIVSSSTLDAGTYSVTQTVLGCTSAAASINVVVNTAAPTPTATSNSPICLSQNIVFNQTAIGGATYSWSGPNGFSSVIQNPTIVGATTLATGVYSVFATLAGCAGQTATLSVIVSSPGTLTVVSPTICANNAIAVLNGASSTGSGTWTSSGSGTFAPNSLTGNYTPTAAEISAGSTTLTLTSTNNGGCVPVTTTTSILITPAPTASAGANQTVCANNANVSLSGSVTIASGGVWSSSGTGTFVPNNTVLNASYVPSAADISGGSFTLTLSTTGNGNCVSVINSKVITISPAPIVIPGANPQVVCKNNPNFQLNGSSTTGSGTWASSGTGTFSASNNILNPIYIPSTADTLAGFVTLTLTSTNNGGCNLVSQTMSIVYINTLTVNAGGNQTVCSNNAAVTLNGVSTTSAGVWTSSGTGTFSPNANLLSTNYIPSAADILAGGVTLTLTTANNGGCNPISTTMSITITPGPTANAGSNQTVCANNATVALTGSFTIAGGGIWTSSGTGTFSPGNTSMNVNYIASSADTTAGSVIITLSTTSNGNCNATTNTMVINFTPAPLVNPGINISVCKTNAVAVLNGYSSTGSGTWTTSGTGTFSPSNAVLNPSYTPSTADTTAGFVTLSLTSVGNGGCNAVTQSLTITYSGIPSVTAGASQTVCANNSTVVLTGTASTGSGTWTSSGTGSFVPNTQNGNYIPSGLDITGGSVTLTLTSTNNGGCLSVAQQMTVSFSPAPQIEAGASQTLCSNTSSINLSGSFTVATGGIWSSSGTGTFNPNNTNSNTSYIPTTADTLAGNVTLYFSSTGNGNCLQVKDSVKVNFIKAPFAIAGANISLCPYSPNPTLNGITSVTSFTWSTSGSGSFSPANTILNPVYVPSAGDNSAGSVTLTLLTASATCGSAADTMVVRFNAKPVAAFTYTNKCIGASTSFTDVSLSMNTGSVVSWYWHFDADTSTIQNPVYTFSTSGSHTVTLLVSNGNCLDSIVKPFFVNPLPTSGFTFTPMCHDSVKFVQTSTVTPGGISTFNWDFGDFSTSILDNPYHEYADTGMYIVTLFIQSDSGCKSSVIDTVHVQKCASDLLTVIGEPAVPSGFTPNGDGSNDVLFVKGGPFNNLDFRIFNEWGNQIFYSDIQSNGWDGTYKSALQPGGRFIWTLNGELIDGRKVKMAGEVILNR